MSRLFGYFVHIISANYDNISKHFLCKFFFSNLYAFLNKFCLAKSHDSNRWIHIHHWFYILKTVYVKKILKIGTFLFFLGHIF